MDTQSDKPKTLEMRVAELEDKIAKLHITEDEMKTYQKVASALGAGAMPPQAVMQLNQQMYAQPWYQQYHQPPCFLCYRQPWYHIQPCYYQVDCIGPQQTSPIAGGGFTTLGR